ncbi:MAG TPA: hypothetical protein VEK15_09750, partial [Vicinamibacteria bacterium]|nr:hypothetical protein [Vicinamibacteria bacterium]
RVAVRFDPSLSHVLRGHVLSPEAVTAERRHEVREAFVSWKHAGLVDEATLDAVVGRFPDDRVRVKLAFRVLLFCFTAIALLATAGVLGVLGAEATLFCLVLGVGSFALTEIQIVQYRRAQGGTEAATSFLAVCFLTAFFLLLFEDSGIFRDFLRVTTLLTSILFALASWRWGFALYGGISAALGFAFLAVIPGARISWILAALVLIPFSFAAARSERLAPSHRAAFTQILAVAVLALYGAVHVTSYERGLLEDLSPPVSQPWRPLSVVATAGVPIALLFLGITRRHRPFLHLGILLVASSLVTLRFYVHVAPLWVVLTGSGGALIALVMLVRNYLRSGRSGDRYGFMADRLDTRSGTELLEIGAAMTTLAPEAAAPSREPAFKGGGGESGGGGASGQY